jgi:glyoxylase-like metal-dependent hydrolase (beta-lactamase superfamily II)
MEFQLDVIFPGFPGRLSNGGLGWSTIALIKGHGQVVLLDAGGPVVRGSLLSSLAARGLKPEDIDTVVLTHLHWDHAYNIDFFPKAQFVLAEEEWASAWELPTKDVLIERKALEILHLGRTRLLPQGCGEIMPGVKTVFLPGHTPGSIGVLIDQGTEGRWLFAGDSCKNRKELASGQAEHFLDPVLGAKSLSEIKTLADRVLPGHDGWLKIDRDGSVKPEGETEVIFVMGEGLEVNGGSKSLTVRLDN